MYFKKLIHPKYFQGTRKKDHYFEGWYYKLVSQDLDYTLAFIPGVSINKVDPHAFIQVFLSQKTVDHVDLKTYYLRFDIACFSYGKDSFYVQIQDNYFSEDKLILNLEMGDLKLNGSLEIQGITPIGKNIWMPNIMGPFGYLTFMECYHGIVSMTHRFKGALTINQKEISFDESKGYIEKDWGKSFPRAYVWLQSNHFEDKETSFMFSYADIPFLGFYFKGLIANLYYQNREYRFATYNFTRIKKEELFDHEVKYTLKKGKYKLEIHAKSTSEISLASPRNGLMIEQIKEGLSGFITLRLYQRNHLIYEDTGHHAGIEIMK